MSSLSFELTSRFNALDWAVFFLILLITVAAVIYGNRRKKAGGDSYLDFLLMGRQLTLPLFVGTLVATWYGGIFGVTRIAFEEGIYNFITQGFFWYFTYIVFAFFLVERIRSTGVVVTLPDLVGRMFGPKSRRLAAVFNLLNVIPVAYTISIGILLSALFGWKLLPAMVIGIIFVTTYSLFGGFRAVVYSDLVQFLTMFSAVVMVLVFSVWASIR